MYFKQDKALFFKQFLLGEKLFFQIFWGGFSLLEVFVAVASCLYLKVCKK
jgi:hypothetical protein